MKKLYKYLGANSIPHVFKKKAVVSLRCSYPKDYNDPFELFLAVDHSELEEVEIAFYLNLLGELPQLPTTCFSRRPDVTPMWAHYGDTHQGIVLEFDEKKLGDAVHFAYLDNVAYRKKRVGISSDLIRFASATGKFRHEHAVLSQALRMAYFTKSTEWSYEKERRMVVSKIDTRVSRGVMLLQLPLDCITAIAMGINNDDQEFLAKKASSVGARLLKARIGRSCPTPYFMEGSRAQVFDARKGITPSLTSCAKCQEPVNIPNVEQCHWCSIGDEERFSAMTSLSMLDGAGLRQQFYPLQFSGVRSIGRKS